MFYMSSSVCFTDFTMLLLIMLTEMFLAAEEEEETEDQEGSWQSAAGALRGAKET